MGRFDPLARRLLDVAVSATVVLALAPVFLLVAVLVRATSRGPVLFVQQRVGRNGQLFGLLKFRTMVADASRRGPVVTIGADSRITGVGAVLRRFKLDELPQFLNVLRGDMSLVGPRPEVPRYVDGYTPEQRRLLAVRPGITDPASLVYSDEAAVLASYPDPERAYVEIVLPHKLTISLEYLARRSLWSDLAIVMQTALRMLAPGRAGAAVGVRRSPSCASGS